MNECPSCDRTLDRADRFCPACQLEVRFEAQAVVPVYPRIVPGRVVSRFDLRAGPPPEVDVHAPTQLSANLAYKPDGRGALFVVSAVITRTLRDLKTELRDGCVRASFTALTPRVRVGLSARAANIGKDAFTNYALEASVDARTAWPIVSFDAGKDSTFKSLVRTTHPTPYIAGVGSMNTIELRVQGPTLAAYANGEHLFSLHEPTYGFGAFGIRVGRDGEPSAPPAEVVVHEIEIAEVSP